ncbi:hypothetical protein [Tychonema sp. LEGE 06208]|uniref:hypothetical protein n=1 Tax=Tychonema sp. LEGE 06208 TaxID=1828663 RepID=UPI00187E52D9|nr:hypothetical protein [Tychonema sp. LEGE 06208]MBE9163248.1 hypothetical protein [Tychonema sp. LEGE 06208]
MKEEGRRKREEGRRKFGNGLCNGCNGCNGCKSVGRRKKEEGRFAQFSPSRPLALSPSLPLSFSEAIELLLWPDRPFASPVNAIFCKNTVNLYWKNISSS